MDQQQSSISTHDETLPAETSIDHLDEPITLESVYNLLCIVLAKLEDIHRWKDDVEKAMSEVQSSGMLGMVSKLLFK